MRARRLTTAAGPFCGPGLHSGVECRVELQPAAAGAGLVFTRPGLAPGDALPGALQHAVAQPRRTSLARGPISFETVEHVLSALHGIGIRDARIVVDGPELPALDGSAAPIASALLAASAPERRGRGDDHWEVVAPFSHSEGGGDCALAPHDALRIDCAIDFEHPALGAQQRTFVLGDPRAFLAEIAPARTFGLLRDAAALRRAGLARGASRDTVLVFDDEGVLDGASLRFPDEPVRHKILDAIGDLALLECPLRGRLQLQRCGHALLLRTLRAAIAARALHRVTGLRSGPGC